MTFKIDAKTWTKPIIVRGGEEDKIALIIDGHFFFVNQN